MWLYHATYRTNLRSIKDNGLGAKQIKNWEFSEDDVVCLCTNPETAFSFCECSELASDYKINSGIIVLAVDSKRLNRNRVNKDPNVLIGEQEDDVRYYTYRGIISPDILYVITRKMDDNNLKPIGPISWMKRVPGYE